MQKQLSQRGRFEAAVNGVARDELPHEHLARWVLGSTDPIRYARALYRTVRQTLGRRGQRLLYAWEHLVDSRPALAASAAAQVDEPSGKLFTMLAGKQPHRALGGSEATTERVLEERGKAQYVHLATHGAFKASLLAEERKRIEAQLKQWHGPADRGTAVVGLGIRNPLSYVGVALAGANEPGKAGPDGGILSGEAIVEQQLAGLSACETGLGEYTQAEGCRG